MKITNHNKLVPKIIPITKGKLMKKFKHMISEAAYPGNVGFEELVKFYRDADKQEIKKMDKIIKAEDWEGFKNLIQKVSNIKLK